MRLEILPLLSPLVTVVVVRIMDFARSSYQDYGTLPTLTAPKRSADRLKAARWSAATPRDAASGARAIEWLCGQLLVFAPCKRNTLSYLFPY